MARVKVTPELIDKTEFEELLFLGLSTDEIRDYFTLNSCQLWAWIKVAYNTKDPLVMVKKLRVRGKIDFLDKQRKLAERNPTMAIWFGKNYFDQTDGKEETEQADFEDLNPLVELLKDDDDGNSDSNN